MLLNPEISIVEGADVFRQAEGSIIQAEAARLDDPSGVVEQGTSTWGFPRNLGDPAASAERRYRKAKETKPKGWASGSRSAS